MKKLSFVLCVLSVLYSCTDEQITNDSKSTDIVSVSFKAYVDDTSDADPLVLWERGDSVSLVTGENK